MNQQIQQKQILEQRMLGEANFQVANKRIRRSQQIPGFDGNANVSPELLMTNLGTPLTVSLAIGFTIGFMRR